MQYHNSYVPVLLACTNQWNYDRSFDDYVIADATDTGCVIQFLDVVHYAAIVFYVPRTPFSH